VNGDALGDSVSTWVKVISLLGVPSVIAMFLVWTLTGTLREQQDRIELKIDQHETQRVKDAQQLTAFLYAICLNGAKGATETARCGVALDGSLGTRPK
jgi:hypothetical protein